MADTYEEKAEIVLHILDNQNRSAWRSNQELIDTAIVVVARLADLYVFHPLTWFETGQLINGMVSVKKFFAFFIGLRIVGDSAIIRLQTVIFMLKSNCSPWYFIHGIQAHAGWIMESSHSKGSKKWSSVTRHRIVGLMAWMSIPHVFVPISPSSVSSGVYRPTTCFDKAIFRFGSSFGIRSGTNVW